MPKTPRLTFREAQSLLEKNGFTCARMKGSHAIFMKGKRRVVVPSHAGKTLHPKIVKQIQRAIDDAE